jgi:hypothetical protein
MTSTLRIPAKKHPTYSYNINMGYPLLRLPVFV